MSLVDRAVMADLGRHRQEELPLSTLEVRGPSFRRPMVDDSRLYSSEVKGALRNKWATAIVDEEAGQMQGLANLHARPWAANGRMPPSGGVFQTARPAAPATKSAPKPASQSIHAPAPTPAPAPVSAPAQQSLPRPIKTIQDFTQQPLSGQKINNTPILAAVAAVRAAQSKDAQPQRAPASQVQALSSKTNDQTQSPALNGAPKSLSSIEKLLELNGCAVSLANGTKVAENATVVVYVQSKNAFLMLITTGKTEEVHNLQFLEAPTLRGKDCIVKGKPGKGSSEYVIKTTSAQDAAQLVKIVYTLQMSLAKLKAGSANSVKLLSDGLAKNTNGAINDNSNAVVPQANGGSVSHTHGNSVARANGSSLNNTNGSSVIKGPVAANGPVEADQKQSLKVKSPVPKLLDVASGNTLSMASVMNDLFVIALSAHRQFTGDSALKVEDPGRYPDEMTILECMQSGHLDSEMRPEAGILLELMRFLTTMKRKVDNLDASNASSSMNDLKELGESSTRPEQSIKYSSKELLDMRRGAKRSAAELLELNGASYQKKQMTESSRPVSEAPVAAKAIKAGGLASSRWAK